MALALFCGMMPDRSAVSQEASSVEKLVKGTHHETTLEFMTWIQREVDTPVFDDYQTLCDWLRSISATPEDQLCISLNVVVASKVEGKTSSDADDQSIDNSEDARPIASVTFTSAIDRETVVVFGVFTCDSEPGGQIIRGIADKTNGNWALLSVEKMRL